jgi:hypothetical protein
MQAKMQAGRCKLEDASWKFIGMIVQLAQAQRF